MTPGSSCIANAYASNHARLENEDLGFGTWLFLHAVDAVGAVRAIILRIQGADPAGSDFGADRPLVPSSGKPDSFGKAVIGASVIGLVTRRMLLDDALRLPVAATFSALQSL